MIANPRIERLLIANRGEIALRIQRACNKLGISTVSVASEVDARALHAREAQELVIIGPPQPEKSYLSIEKLIDAALRTKCNAIHPGYGFLSENAEFARASINAGLIFVGPSPESIEALGSKSKAREIAARCSVPTTPGSKEKLSDEELAAVAESIGFPVIIKAVAGGGGRGMRIVNSRAELMSACTLARSEALKNFKSDNIYLEKFLARPRHVEVQILGDTHGNVVHLGTRDCSVQRRHQKVIEEAPAPDLPEGLRAKLHESAVKVAKEAKYHSTGTAEFLVDKDDFYFLEMNTRIQVEHPVTEAVTGRDLVELQLLVAQGEKIPFSQQDVSFSGHAMEFRIYAEDPENGFRPATGKIGKIVRPVKPTVREDFGYESGDQVSPYYDAMLSKVIVLGETREDCLEKSREFLDAYRVEGLSNNVALLQYLLYNSVFKSSPPDIAYLDREFRADTIRAWKASRVRDPRHCSPNGGAEVKNVFNYKSSKFNKTYTIEVLHRADGFFLATPVDESGRRAKNKNCRLSNGLNTVVKSLIDDVLETTSPKDLFGV